MTKRKSRPPSPRSQALLQTKRDAARVLKQAGILRRRGGKRVTTKYLKESSWFRKLRKDFAGLIKGEMRAAKVPHKQIKVFKSIGVKTFKNIIVVPRLDDCLDSLKPWFYANADPLHTQGSIAERWLELVQLALQYPNDFRAIISVSHNAGSRFLRGLPPQQKRWPSTEGAEKILAAFPELYHYHPTSRNPTVRGGLIPRC